MTGYSTYFTALTGSSGASLVGGGIIGLNFGFVTAQLASSAVREAAYSSSGPGIVPQARVIIPRSGTLKNYHTDVKVNALVNPLMIDLLVNGVSVATLSYLAAATGLQTSGAVVAVVGGDEVSYGLTTAVTGVAAQRADFIASTEFVPS